MSDDPAAGLVLSVDLAGRPVTGVGAGRVAWRKYRSLLAAGARLTVVAPEACDAVTSAAASGDLDWSRRPYADGDLRGALLAVAATSDPSVNRRVAADAEAAGTLCVRIDGGGTASMAAAVHRGPLTLAVASSGTAPALAMRIREELEDRYGPEYGELAALMGRLRHDPDVSTLLSALPESERALRWHAILAGDTLSLLRSGDPDEAKEAALACLSSSAD